MPRADAVEGEVLGSGKFETSHQKLEFSQSAIQGRCHHGFQRDAQYTKQLSAEAISQVASLGSVILSLQSA